MAHTTESIARRFLLPVLTVAMTIGTMPTVAADAVGKSSDAKVSVAQPDASGKPSTTTGAVPVTSVKTIALTAERQLRLMGEAVKRVRRAASDLASECTQPLEMMGEIDIIGTDVIPIMPATAEGFGNQYIPPRPKYVNLHMSQLTNLIPILEDDIQTINVPDAEKDYASPLVADAKNYLADVKKHYDILVSLTKPGTDYDATSIVNECRGIHAATGDIDSDRKKLLHEDKKIEKTK